MIINTVYALMKMRKETVTFGFSVHANPEVCAIKIVVSSPCMLNLQLKNLTYTQKGREKGYVSLA